MRHLKNLLLGLFVLGLLSRAGYMPSHAQDSQAPLLIYTGVSILSYDGDTLSPLPGLAEISGFVPYMAPANQHFAFKAVAEFGNEEPIAGAVPTSIYIYDLATSQPERITTQPEDAYFNAEGTNALGRSDPAWSPDGHYLVWCEIPIMTQATPADLIHSVVIYDVEQGTTQVIELDIPPQGLPNPLRVWAGRTAIAIEINAAGFNPKPEFLFYDYAGNYLQTVMLSGDAEDATARYTTWVQFGADDYFAVGYTTGSWVLLSSADDTQIPYTGGIELHNPPVTAGYFMEARFYPQQLENGNTVQRLMVTGMGPAGVAIELPNSTVSSLDRVAIAPDASAVAYLNRDLEIYLATTENVHRLDAENIYATAYIAWGYGVWTLPENTDLP